MECTIEAPAESAFEAPGQSSDKHVIVRNTLANAVVRFLQVASAFIYMPFLIDRFGLADYGVFVLAGSLSIYTGLLDFGVSATLTKQLAEYLASKQRDRAARMVSSAFAYYTVAGVVACALLAAFARWGVHLFRLDVAGVALAAQLFYAAALIALLSWPLSVGASVLNGLQRYDVSALFQASVVIGNLVMVLLVLLAGAGPLALFVLMGLVALASSAGACIAALRMLPDARPRFALVSRVELRGVFSMGWMLFVIQIATLIADQHTDRFVLAVFVGAAAVGLWEPASRLNVLVSYVASMPQSALMPAASKLDAENRTETLRSLFLRGTRYTLILVAPLVLSLMVLAPALLVAWIGPQIASAVPAARVLLVTYLLYANLAVAIPMLVGMGRVRPVMRYAVASALLNLVLSIALVGRFGLLGVAAGTALAELALLPAGLRIALRTFGVTLSEYLKLVAVPASAPLLLPLGIATGLAATPLASSLLGVAAILLTSVAAYWLVTLRLCLDPAERADVASLALRVLARLSKGAR